MAKIGNDTIEHYQKMLARDPNSKVFAALAEALRENGVHVHAERVATDGIRRHPLYVGGYVALGRTLIDQRRFKETLPLLQKAVEIDPQNLLALHLLGNTYLQLQPPKEALRAFKMVLFLNPQSEKARNAVQKLENLTADEYEDDVFEYGSPIPIAKTTEDVKASPEEEFEPITAVPLGHKELERKISLIDALIVRNDLEKARNLMTELALRNPGNADVIKRFELLDEVTPEEDAPDLHPLSSREKQIFDRKRAVLENLLHRIKEYRLSTISETP